MVSSLAAFGQYGLLGAGVVLQFYDNVDGLANFSSNNVSVAVDDSVPAPPLAQQFREPELRYVFLPLAA